MKFSKEQMKDQFKEFIFKETSKFDKDNITDKRENKSKKNSLVNSKNNSLVKSKDLNESKLSTITKNDSPDVRNSKSYNFITTPNNENNINLIKNNKFSKDIALMGFANNLKCNGIVIDQKLKTGELIEMLLTLDENEFKSEEDEINYQNNKEFLLKNEALDEQGNKEELDKSEIMFSSQNIRIFEENIKQKIRSKIKNSKKSTSYNFNCSSTSCSVFNKNFKSKNNSPIKFKNTEFINNKAIYKKSMINRSRNHIKVLLRILKGSFPSDYCRSYKNALKANGIKTKYYIKQTKKLIDYIYSYCQLNIIKIKTFIFDTYELIKDGIVFVIKFEIGKRGERVLLINFLDGDRTKSVEFIDLFLINIELFQNYDLLKVRV